MAQKDLVRGIPSIEHTTQICDICLIGKHSRAPFPKKAKAISTSPLDLVYGDLCGPITPPTPSGKRYVFLLVDDYSRYMWVYFLNTKDQAFDTFKEFNKSIENELRTTLKILRTDRGGEFTSNEFTQYCKENGIARQLTAPAARHAIHILNSVPTKALEDVTPYEAIKQRKPNLENLRIFGCIAYAKDYGITNKHNGGNKIHGFSESSYGVNAQEGKGTTGIIFYYGESPISWSTQKQATVALSSCESEFIAATAAATQALWLKRLLSKLTHSQEEKITIL
nr:zinc finger, CCHC-type [Tanacetum cinerariifolium]